jgi:predicted enzyme related to lactoylglutathione lyase
MSEPTAPARVPWPIKGVITLFYYEDVRRALDFYERVIGLRKVVDFGWCALLEIFPNVHLGLIDSTGGSQRPIPGSNKGAIITLETDDLQACLARMCSLGVAGPQTRVEYNERSRTYDFKVYDPEGYTIEFFCWAEPPPPVTE